MNLSGIVPLAKVEVALGRPVDVERVQTTDVAEALRRNAEHVFGIAAATWRRIPASQLWGVDLSEVRRHLDHKDPALARAIEAVIGVPLLKEFGFLEATVVDAGKPFVVATSCAAHLYSDELHLYDLGLADPARPLSRHTRKAGTQTHRGFGLLGEVVANLFAAARERRCPIVTTTAANPLLVPVYARHGFEVERSAFAEEALASGLAVPMEARL